MTYISIPGLRTKQKRFMESALNSDHDECIIWPFGKTTNGYPIFWLKDENGEIITGRGNRAVCFIVNGKPSSSRMDAAHSCHNRLCINHNHLSWKTRTQNNRDKIKNGTTSRGEKSSMAKLSYTDVVKIKSLLDHSEMTMAEIADIFNVTRGTIGNISTGRTWKNV